LAPLPAAAANFPSRAAHCDLHHALKKRENPYRLST